MPWRNAKVHQHHHIQCLQALYSVPSSRCPPGQKLEARVDSKLVRIYHRDQLIKTHVRQPRGRRATDTQDYPAETTPPKLPRRTFRLHHQGARRHQGQGHRTGSRRG